MHPCVMLVATTYPRVVSRPSEGLNVNPEGFISAILRRADFRRSAIICGIILCLCHKDEKQQCEQTALF